MIELVIERRAKEKFQFKTMSSRKRQNRSPWRVFPGYDTHLCVCLQLAHLPLRSFYCLSLSPVASSSFTGCSLALIHFDTELPNMPLALYFRTNTHDSAAKYFKILGAFCPCVGVR